jgi:hypothetical protein
MQSNTINAEVSAAHVAGGKPSTHSACDTARVVSRKLGKAGFEMSKKIDRWNRSNGFYVKRLGCSSTIFVDYYNPAWMRNPGGDFAHSELKYNREQLRRAIDFLAKAGYSIDDRGYIECERSS